VIGRWTRAAPADSENISNLWSLSSPNENNRPIGEARRRRNFNTAPPARGMAAARMRISNIHTLDELKIKRLLKP